MCFFAALIELLSLVSLIIDSIDRNLVLILALLSANLHSALSGITIVANDIDSLQKIIVFVTF